MFLNVNQFKYKKLKIYTTLKNKMHKLVHNFMIKNSAQFHNLNNSHFYQRTNS